MNADKENEGKKTVIETIGEHLREERRKKKWTLMELAGIIDQILAAEGEKITTQKQMMWGYEKGNNKIPPERLLAAMIALNCTPEQLLYGNGEYEKVTYMSQAPISRKERVYYHGKPVLVDDMYGIYNYEMETVTLMDGTMKDVTNSALYGLQIYHRDITNKWNQLTYEDAVQKKNVWVELLDENEDAKNAYRGWYCYNSQTGFFEGKTFLSGSDYGKKYIALNPNFLNKTKNSEDQ